MMMVMMMVVVRKIILVFFCSLFSPVQLVPVHIKENRKYSCEFRGQEANHNHDEAVAIGVTKQRFVHGITGSQLGADFRLKNRQVNDKTAE